MKPIPLLILLGLTACYEDGDPFFHWNGGTDDSGSDTGEEVDGPHISVTVSTELSADSAFGNVVWYDPEEAFALGFPSEDAPARPGAGAVLLVDRSGAALARTTGPDAGAALGTTISVIDDLLVSGTADGGLYGWAPESGDNVSVEDVATITLTGARAAPSVAPVGDMVWIADPGPDGSAIYAVDAETFVSGIEESMSDLTLIAQDPCGVGIPSCGLTMASDPTGDGALLGLSGGYAQHVEADGTSDWYLAGRFVSDPTVPPPPDGVTSTYTIGDRFIVTGYLDGPNVLPSARWILPTGKIDEGTLDPYQGVFSVAVGVLDGVPYRVFGIGDGRAAVAVEPDEGETSLVFFDGGETCHPRVATDGGSKLLLVCEGETYGVIADLAWE